MDWNKVKVGFALTGSFCTIDKVIPYVDEIVKKGAEVYPIVSYSVATIDTRFGTAENTLSKLEAITGKKVIRTIAEAEPVGPKIKPDVVIVAPCTGNTMGKLANAITDTSVLMAVKSHLRNNKPVVLSIATNDGLGMSNKNIATLLNTKNIYIVPFGQDNYQTKPNSLISGLEYLIPTVEMALEGKQKEPILIEYGK